MTVHLIHGFNVSDGGRGSVGRLQPHIPGAEIAHDYGWAGLVGLRCKNQKAIREILPKIKQGDVLIGHSNGALICWELARRLKGKLGAVIVINPAMRRDALWPAGLPVLCLSNTDDWIVTLGRAWGRLASVGGLAPHGWGAAGRYGFTTGQKNVKSWNTANPLVWGDNAVSGHSALFSDDKVAYWGSRITEWLYRRRLL